MSKQSFAGKSAIVTGAATGVGRALSKELAARGAEVYVTALSVEEAQPVVDEILAAGGRAHAAQTDVTDKSQIAAIIERVVAERGQLDVMVNNAGIVYVGEFDEMDDQTLESLYAINFTAVGVGTLYAYRLMKKQRSGQILNIASMAGLLPSAAMAAYSASKHGVVGLSTSVAAEAEAFDVKVQAACLSFVKSELMDRAVTHRDGASKMVGLFPSEQPTEEAARTIVNGMLGDKRLIFTPFAARLPWLIMRVFPGALHLGSKLLMRNYRQAVGDSTE